MSPLLTPAEAARRLRVSPRTLSRWASQGLIKGTRLPSNRFRYSEDEVQRLIDNPTHEQASA